MYDDDRLKEIRLKFLRENRRTEYRRLRREGEFHTASPTMMAVAAKQTNSQPSTTDHPMSHLPFVPARC